MSTIQTIHLVETTSTNDYLKAYQPKADITAVYADFQTSGRGQSGAWYSPRGENLMFSVLVMPPDLPVADSFIISQAMALALKQTIAPLVSPNGEEDDTVQIKWPNDIYVNSHKMCGTLIENTLHGKMLDRCIIGTGVNINQTEFPQGLAAPATSICLLSGKRVEPQQIFDTIISNFQPYYEAIASKNAHFIDKIRQQYHQSLYLRGIQHLFQDANGQFQGTISHVEHSGHIIITDSEGRDRSYGFKEVKTIHDTI